MLGTQKVDLSGYALKTETRLTDADQTEVLLNSLFTKAWKDSIDASISKHDKDIANEVLARTEADKALGVRIDDVKKVVGDSQSGLVKDVADLKAADVTLDGKIDKEIEDRDVAEAALGTRIDNEVLARTEADKALGARIKTFEDLQISENWTSVKTVAENADVKSKANSESIEAINASIGKLEEVDTAMNARVKTTESEIDALQVTAGTLDATYVKNDNLNTKVAEAGFCYKDQVTENVAKIENIDIDAIVNGDYPASETPEVKG